MEMLLGLWCSGRTVSWEFEAISAIPPCLGWVVGYSQSDGHCLLGPLTQAVWLDMCPHSHLLVPGVHVSETSVTQCPLLGLEAHPCR